MGGIRPPRGPATFEALADELTAVRTPIGDAWILAADEPAFRAAEPTATDAVRLLPSGDTWFLLWGADRELLVPDQAAGPSSGRPACGRAPSSSRARWPGSGGGPDAIVAIQPWRGLTTAERDAVAAEAESLPLPDVEDRIRVRWDD